jgi:hypothetical protein
MHGGMGELGVDRGQIELRAIARANCPRLAAASHGSRSSAGQA